MPGRRLSFLLTVLLLPPLFLPAGARSQQTGSIEVTTPESWSNAAPRTLTVRSGVSIRIEGRVGHPGGVDRVLVDGEPVTLERRPDGQWVFVAYATPEPGASGVEIALYPVQGSRLVQRYPVEVTGQTDQPAETGRTEPWEVSRIQVGLYAYTSGDRNAGPDAQVLFGLTDAIAVGGGFSYSPTSIFVNDVPQDPYVEYYLEGRWYFGGASVIGWAGPHLGYFTRSEFSGPDGFGEVVDTASVTVGAGGGVMFAPTDMFAIDLGLIWLAAPSSLLVRAGLQAGF